jgi:hypothetical protein
MIGNVTVPSPQLCFFCTQPAHIELGRDSFLVDCQHCAISYEINDTAWVAGTSDPDKVRAWVRQQIEAGRSRPYVTVDRVKTGT